ncbi:MAG: hypothetical protein ACAH88_15395, partial [Roseimicrobium sp.]
MSVTESIAPDMSRFAGMLQIVRFNPWPYVISIGSIIFGAAFLTTFTHYLPWWLQLMGVVALGACTWLTLASLVVSHVIYDRSDWPRGSWLRRALISPEPQRVLNVHAGFDETTTRLRHWFPTAEITALDLFDAKVNTESSLLRARASQPPVPGTVTGDLDAWPVPPGSHDVVCLLLTAHEYRREAER